MDSSHVEGVFELSKNSFHIPWSLESIQQELTNNLARYIVAMDSDSNKVIGFAGMWIIAGEGNITNIAVDADFKHHYQSFCPAVRAFASKRSHLIHCCLTKICPTTRGAEALVISSLGFQALLPFVPIVVSVLLKTRKSLRRNDF